MNAVKEITELLETPKLWGKIRFVLVEALGAIELRNYAYNISRGRWPGIDLPCSQCNRANTFACKDGGFFTSFTKPLPGHLLLVTFICQRCSDFERSFLFGTTAVGSELYLVKVAAWPAQRPQGHDAVKDILDAEKADFFRRGMMCEQHGLGMAAHAYYRRIVETSIDEWLDELKAATGEESHQEWLDRHGGRPQMGEQIARLQYFMHDSISGNGKNPINALYSTLSEGLHSLSDEDCLVLAEVLRELLVFTLRKISEVRDKGDLIQETQDKLNRIKSKLANPQQQSKG